MPLTIWHYSGVLFTFLVVFFLSFAAMKQVKKSDDFLLGKKGMSPAGVMGILLGTILGASSTVGTAQMAFSEGITGIFMTFGCATGIAGMALLLPRLKRIHGVNTIPQLLCRRYGQKARPITGVISICGIFFSVVSSNLAMSDLIASLGNTTIFTAYEIIFGLIMVYVLFGGMLGASWVGLFKTVMLYILLIISGIITYKGLFGASNGIALLPDRMIYDLFPKGWAVGLMSYFSAIVGVMSTQTYLQAYYPARDLKSAQQGYLLSSLFILPVGILSVGMGLFMKAYHPELLASQAVPYFIFHYLPPLVGGMGASVLVLGGLGTVSGLLIGLTTIVLKDIVGIFIPNLSEKQALWSGRLFVALIGLGGVSFSFWQHGSQILMWNYLSMGLRGAGVFLPFLAAMLLPRRFNSSLVILSMAVSTAVVLYIQFFTSQGVRSLGYGIATSFFILVIAYWRRKVKRGT